jgi:hypothetical protein
VKEELGAQKLHSPTEPVRHILFRTKVRSWRLDAV